MTLFRGQNKQVEIAQYPQYIKLHSILNTSYICRSIMGLGLRRDWEVGQSFWEYR